MKNLSDKDVIGVVDTKCLNEKLSIFIPTYNRCNLLKDTLNSLVHEVHKYNIPIIISDNNSTDDTENMVNEFKNKYTNIFYSKNKKNVGLDKNMLLALKLVKTEYCFMLGDDDLLIEGGFEKVMKMLAIANFNLILLTEMSRESKRKSIELETDMILNYCRTFFDGYWDKMPFGSIIINLELAKSVDVSKFIGTSHAYSGLIWEYLAKNELEGGSINVLIMSDSIVYRGESEKTYKHKLSELYFLEIPRWFQKLHPIYNAEKAMRYYMRKQEKFINLISHRVEGELNMVNLRYLTYYFSSFGKAKSAIVSIFPKFFFKTIIAAYRYLSKIKGRLQHDYTVS